MADLPTQVPVDSERAFALIGKMHFQIIDQQGMLQAASNEIRALKKFIEGLNTKIAELENAKKEETLSHPAREAASQASA